MSKRMTELSKWSNIRLKRHIIILEEKILEIREAWKKEREEK